MSGVMRAIVFSVVAALAPRWRHQDAAAAACWSVAAGVVGFMMQWVGLPLVVLPYLARAIGFPAILITTLLPGIVAGVVVLVASTIIRPWRPTTRPCARSPRRCARRRSAERTGATGRSA